jgi:hypothetical protein
MMSYSFFWLKENLSNPWRGTGQITSIY